MQMSDYLELIRNARVYDVAERTPVDLASNLSRRLGNRVLMKREDLQPVFSFKLRGAYNKIAQLADDQLGNGVICSSAGNHAQGVALAARRRGVRAVIVMPITTPSIKTDAVSALGGEVVLYGDTDDDAYAHALELAEKQNLVFIHPFDDPLVIAGQGTIGKEILEQVDEKIDILFVPVGGGGLIAGIAAWVRQMRPEIRIVGVEPDDSDAMSQSLAAGRPVTLAHVGIFADGVAVRRVGDETFRLCRELVDEIIIAVAGAKKYVAEHGLEGKTLVTISCGANVNFDRLRHIAERAAVGEQAEMLLAAEIPEKPGSFKRFCETVGRRGITEFNYRYADDAKAHIFVGVQLRHGMKERLRLLEQLRAAGFPVEDLSDNEMAKLHVRHMVGGRAPGVTNERLFRFEFPERPGALLDFLNAIGTDWNISLFHYRNHGSDYGRILAGIDVPPEDFEELESHLAKLGYPHWEESDNPAYAMFLA
jgi:threonine dehydratase